MNPEIISTTTEEYKELIESLKKDGFEICRDILVLSLVEEGIEEIFEDYLIFQRLGFGFPSVFGGVDTLVSIS